MPNICTVCRHPRRSEIDKELVAGEPLRVLAKRTGTSVGALFRHRRDHIPAALAKAKDASEKVEARTLFERLHTLSHETRTILREARESGNHGLALNAIGRAEKQLELEARLLGELNESVKVAVGVNIEQTQKKEVVVLLAEVCSPAELADLEQRMLAARARKIARLNSAADPSATGVPYDSDEF